MRILMNFYKRWTSYLETRSMMEYRRFYKLVEHMKSLAFFIHKNLLLAEQTLKFFGYL